MTNAAAPSPIRYRLSSCRIKSKIIFCTKYLYPDMNNLSTAPQDKRCIRQSNQSIATDCPSSSRSQSINMHKVHVCALVIDDNLRSTVYTSSESYTCMNKPVICLHAGLPAAADGQSYIHSALRLIRRFRACTACFLAISPLLTSATCTCTGESTNLPGLR